MKTIRISDEVWEAMTRIGKFGETADDVLRRALIGSNVNGSPEDRTQLERTRTHSSTDNSTYSQTKPPGWKERRATKTMTQNKEGNDLVFRFDGGAVHRCTLPSQHDKASIRQKRDQAVAWAKQNGATDGQIGAVMRAFTSRGFHVK